MNLISFRSKWVAASFALILVGCAGNGNNLPSGTVRVSNTIPQVTGTAVDAGGNPVAIPPATTTRTVTLVVNGTQLTNVLLAPSTTTIPAGAPLVVFPAGTRIIPGVAGSAPLTRAPGEMTINGQQVGTLNERYVDPFGFLQKAVSFGPGKYKIRLDGPYEMGGLTPDEQITVGKFEWNVTVNAEGFISLPDVECELPVNGGSTRNGNIFVKATVRAPFRVGNATLEIIKSNGNLAQTKSTEGSNFTFKDLTVGGGNPNIPTSGIEELRYTHQP